MIHKKTTFSQVLVFVSQLSFFNLSQQKNTSLDF